MVICDINPESGRNAADTIGRAGGQAAFLAGDVSRDADAGKMVDFTVQIYGGLDILVNNAGIEILHPCTEIVEEDFDRITAVNYKSIYLLSKYAVPELVKREGGSIVNVASVAGLIGFPLLGAYTGSKHAVVGLTKVMALELRSQNIRVNALCPAVIDTPLARRGITIWEEQGLPIWDLIANQQGRMGEPEEVAYAALFLASDEASFITGVALPVDNGFTAA